MAKAKYRYQSQFSLGPFPPGSCAPANRQGEGAQAEAQAGLLLDPTFTAERYRSLAASDHRRYLANRERTIQALQAAGVPEGRKVSREKSS